jgi:chromosome segregation ATPase
VLDTERQQHQHTRETLQQRLEQAVTGAHERTRELALDRDKVSTLTARLASQETAFKEQQLRIGQELDQQTDRSAKLEKQRDKAWLAAQGERESVATLRGEADALQRQNQSLLAALAGHQ